MKHEKKTLCSDTGLYKSFLDLLKLNTEYCKNMEKCYQTMFGAETTKILIECSKSFIISYNNFSFEEKLNNIYNIKNNLISYELILKTLVDLKILSIKQFSNLGLLISKIKGQIKGFENKINEQISI